MNKISLGISAIKSLSWRVIASLTTTILVFIFTGELTWAIGIGIADVITKLVLYFIHERIWEVIKRAVEYEHIR